MKEGQCQKCGKATEREKAFEVGGSTFCTDCFLTMAQTPRQITGEQRAALKKAVKEEMAGLLPRDALAALIEEGYGRLVQGADFDEEVHRLVNEIERLAGLALCKEMLSLLAAMRSGIDEQEDEVRGKMKRIAQLDQ